MGEVLTARPEKWVRMIVGACVKNVGKMGICCCTAEMGAAKGREASRDSRAAEHWRVEMGQNRKQSL